MGHFDRTSLLALLPAAAYSLAYLITRWDAMKGAFLSWLYANVVLIVAALLLPGIGAPPRTVAPQHTQPHQTILGEVPPGAVHPAAGFPGAVQAPMLPPGVDAPVMRTQITLIVTGLNDQAARQAFGDKLGELAKKVSGGFMISSSASGEKSTDSISMVNSVDVKAFADQITWARVTRISGQTIMIDAALAAGD
jgi:hypothetical protein